MPLREMDRFFNSDSAVMRAMSKVFDMCFLSLIYLVFCVPVVTFGAATTSLYYVSAKVLRHNRSYVWREFWHCFKENFVRSTILGVLYLVVDVVLVWNFLVTYRTEGFGGYLSGAYVTLFFIVACVACYAFPILSRFDMKIPGILRFSVYCAFRHFLHTLAMIGIFAAGVAGLVFGFTSIFIIVAILAPGLMGYVYTFPMEHVMKKYMPKPEPRYTPEGEQILEWYQE